MVLEPVQEEEAPSAGGVSRNPSRNLSNNRSDVVWIDAEFLPPTPGQRVQAALSQTVFEVAQTMLNGLSGYLDRVTADFTGATTRPMIKNNPRTRRKRG